VIGFLVHAAAAFLFARQYTFDVLFVWTFGYAGPSMDSHLSAREEGVFRAVPAMDDGSDREVGTSRAGAGCGGREAKLECAAPMSLGRLPVESPRRSREPTST
jgi:hypothetical protein